MSKRAQIACWILVSILLLMGIGMPFMFVTLSTLSLSTIARADMTDASSIYTLARRIGGNIGYALVATGRCEVMVDPIMNVWDCAPFPPIFREAGGFFGSWRGEETIYAGEALATTPALLPQVLSVLHDEPLPARPHGPRR